MMREDLQSATRENGLERSIGKESGKSSRRGGARGILIVIVILLVFGGLFLAGYLPRKARDTSVVSETKAEANAWPEVNVAKTVRAAAVSSLILPGSVEAITEAPIFGRAAGFISKRNVDIGDRVKANQVLAEIETPELDQQVRQARANVEQLRASLGQAEAALNQAKANEELATLTSGRNNRLVERGVLSKQEGDQTVANQKVQTANRIAAEAAINVAKQNVASSEASLQRLITLQSYQKVLAPFAGVITKRDIDIGALVDEGKTLLFRVARTDVLRIFVNTPQSDATGIRVGQAADVSVSELPGRKFAGHVTRTSNSLDPATRTLLTEVQVQNPGPLLPGMYAQVALETRREVPPVMVSGDALVTRPTGTQVAQVVGGDTIHFQSVQLGRDFGVQTEILSGLSEGETVVLNPTDDIREGSKVRPAQPRPKPAPSQTPTQGKR